MWGMRIRELREQRHVKASDVERTTRALADAKHNPEFYVSHSTLADIEAGSIPSIYKLFGLAISLRLSLDDILRQFGVDPEEIASYGIGSPKDPARLTHDDGAEQPGFRFHLNFDVAVDARQTTLLRGQPREMASVPAVLQARGQPREMASVPAVLQARMNPRRYRYAVIGEEDDSMADLLPPRSLAEIDTMQATVQVGTWRTLRERPIYLIWHTDGYACCWCQVNERELMLVPHPLSPQLVRRFKMPREASVIGRVVNAWLPFGTGQLREGGS